MESVDKPKSGNPLGMASAVVSILGLTFCLLAVTSVLALDLKRAAASKKISETQYSKEDLSVITDRIGVGLTALGQILIYVVGLLVGGTLSLVGLALAVAGLPRHPNGTAKVGVGASLLGGLALMSCFLLLWWL